MPLAQASNTPNTQQKYHIDPSLVQLKTTRFFAEHQQIRYLSKLFLFGNNG